MAVSDRTFISISNAKESVVPEQTILKSPWKSRKHKKVQFHKAYLYSGSAKRKLLSTSSDVFVVVVFLFFVLFCLFSLNSTIVS